MCVEGTPCKALFTQDDKPYATHALTLPTYDLGEYGIHTFEHINLHVCSGSRLSGTGTEDAKDEEDEPKDDPKVLDNVGVHVSGGFQFGSSRRVLASRGDIGSESERDERPNSPFAYDDVNSLASTRTGSWPSSSGFSKLRAAHARSTPSMPSLVRVGAGRAKGWLCASLMMRCRWHS